MRVPSTLSRLSTLLLASAVATTAIPRSTHALVGGGLFSTTNSSKFLYNVCDPLGGTIFSCTKTVIRIDPKGDVTHIDMTLDYDWSGPEFVFNAALSGLLGPFAVGGSEPPPSPGIGTVPLPIFSSVLDTPGTPNPGWQLSIFDDGLAVHVNYLNVSGSPVHPLHETNYFVFVFDRVHPIVIDASQSTVTYNLGVDPDAKFVETNFSCETTEPSHPCGSSAPSASISMHLAAVPEPSTLVLFGTCLTLGIVWRRRRV